MTMRRLDDEILMAYADDALSQADRRHVEAELARDPGARRVLSQFRSTAVLARHAYDEPMWSDPPRRLLAAIEAAAPRPRRTHAWPAWITGWPGVGGLVAAASLATLVVTGGVLWQQGPLRPHGAPSDGALLRVAVGNVPNDSELSRVLNGLAGRRPGRVDSRFTLVATLTDKWGHTCQEVDAHAQTPDGPPALVLVACRAAAGNWNVVGAVSPVLVVDGTRREAYVRSEAAAHDAMASVLAMIGARQRASALKPETQQQ